MEETNKLVCFNNQGMENELSINKEYIVMYGPINEFIFIDNDLGIIEGYEQNNFMSRDRYREISINSLLDDHG